MSVMRFTERAQQAILFAQEDARRLRNHSVEPFHVLLGILRVPYSTGGKALQCLGLSPHKLTLLALELEEFRSVSDLPLPSEIPFGRSAKRALEASVDAAKDLGRGEVGTEHLLAGVARVFEESPESPGRKVLWREGAAYAAIMDHIRTLTAAEEAEGVVGAVSLSPSMGSAGEVPARAAAWSVGTRMSLRDRISLNGIECRVRLGVPDKERKTPQKVLIDLELGIALRRAGASDDAKDTVDYFEIEKRVRSLAQTGAYKLLERLAECVAQAALDADPRIRWTAVSVRKRPEAMPKTREVVVEIRRARG